MREFTIEKPFNTVIKGGFLKDGNSLCETEFNPSDITLFQEAIYLGYLDSCRTMKSSKTDVIGILKNEDQEKNIACKLKRYFEMDVKKENDFDTFHHHYCDNIIEQFKYKDIDISYGHAQKITNMAFKYLCCCNEIGGYTNHFKPCHMPLDSIILEWFWREANKKKDYGVIKSKIKPWSKMKYENNETQYGYTFYVETIRKLLKNKCPFTEEFIIWERMKKELACENFYFTFSPKVKREEFKIKTLDEKLTEIKDMIGNALK